MRPVLSGIISAGLYEALGAVIVFAGVYWGVYLARRMTRRRQP